MKHTPLKVIAFFKAIRGLIALSVSVAFFLAWQSGSQAAFNNFPVLNQWRTQDSFFYFLSSWLGNITSQQILAIALIALCSGILRWIEGIGIWFNKSWAEALAVVSGSIYIPFEVYTLTQGYSVAVMSILILNCLVVGYLVFVLIRKQRNVKQQAYKGALLPSQ
jgi:uncharacterized membrane protein (DUF2068 family)